MSLPIDSPNYKHNPEAWWLVRYFVRSYYIDVEVQAPNEHYAKIFASNTLELDGIPRHIISGIGVKQIDGPSDKDQRGEIHPVNA